MSCIGSQVTVRPAEIHKRNGLKKSSLQKRVGSSVLAIQRPDW